MSAIAEAPAIVSPREWQAAREELLAKEKAHTRAYDELAAQRRSLPRMRVERDYAFIGPTGGGEVAFEDLFEGRSQLIVYHFMWEGPIDPETRCFGCSITIDSTPHPSHLHARDTTLALFSPRVPLAELDEFKDRMGWDLPWYSGSSEFNDDFGVEPGRFGLNVFLRQDDEILRTYHTNGRGTEHLGTTWGYLDLTPFGRQENWQAAPAGTPQGEMFWPELHDEYPGDAVAPSCCS